MNRMVYGFAMFVLCWGAFFCEAGLAQTDNPYTITEMTPELKAALDRRRERYDRLQALKGQGKIGETADGFVKAMDTAGDVVRLVEEENTDRRIIYKIIAAQNKVPDVTLVQKVFAKEHHSRSPSGTPLQQEDGSWVKKP